MMSMIICNGWMKYIDLIKIITPPFDSCRRRLPHLSKWKLISLCFCYLSVQEVVADVNRSPSVMYTNRTFCSWDVCCWARMKNLDSCHRHQLPSASRLRVEEYLYVLWISSSEDREPRRDLEDKAQDDDNLTTVGLSYGRQSETIQGKKGVIKSYLRHLIAVHLCDQVILFFYLAWQWLASVQGQICGQCRNSTLMRTSQLTTVGFL